ncbi:transcriptional regulator [Bacillus sp. J14TS2]|uniref:ArsR/SmtB family transcription factor n=1 Tax=Bacillus sp. J14TS2 TaxID=2807188 RepID=UPI001B2B63FE|nr:winged helix-turn-helix domain-containing protein [Bacillus sp. J14TS2]GIN72992.1 transcriptional regulator [Bacillus sp. J14TS2]
MKQMKVLETFDQLKALGDPFRAEIMMRLLEKPYTGQQLSELFNVSRATIHYHLKNLEKNELIYIVKTEEKNGIVQKFYQSVARGFTPSTELLPHVKEVGDSIRQLLVQMVEMTKSELLSAPSISFKKENETPSEWSYLSSIWEISATRDQFQEFIKEFYELVTRFEEEVKETDKEPEVNLYHLSVYGFQVEEPMFEVPIDDEKERKR